MASNLPMEEYQALIEGKFVSVDKLTLEQAQSALCDAFDMIEEIDTQLVDLNNRMDQWRNASS